MENIDKKAIFKYTTFQSFVNADFWYKLAEIKIDIDKLNDDPKSIYGFYTNLNCKNCIMNIDCTAFNSEFLISKHNFKSHGVLLNKNTIEEFKNCDKTELLIKEAQNFWNNNIITGNFIDDPSLLCSFILLSFADLKKHNFYYWFAFPAPIEPIIFINSENKTLEQHFSVDEINQMTHLYFNISNSTDKSFFFLENNNSKITINLLKDKISKNNKCDNLKNINFEEIYFCYSDPCEFDEAGWLLRMFIVSLLYYCPNLKSKCIKVISIRVKDGTNLSKSIIYDVELPDFDVNKENLKWCGWERNNNGKYIPKLAAMADNMDPAKLAENSINLNLKLMKWRLLPDLDLDIISNQKCLLLGAGTLGCAVSRILIAWGIKDITFVDYGNVSYSNPVRQNLYSHLDAINGKKKAIVAAEKLKEIHPQIKSEGYVLQIPMPGHPVSEATYAKTLDDIKTIESLIKSHDIIYLLTDSRESRWLPTLLAASYNKIVINAALGFDSYLVMRHGVRKPTKHTIDKIEIKGLKCLSGDKLGCYFCNDITAPGNSMKDRTLDQQCTVTRPSASNIASALAVELMIGIIHHPDRELAPAYITIGNQKEFQQSTLPEGLLGILPHSIRGILSSYEQLLPATEYFPYCIACSDNVLSAYENEGHAFLFKVFNSSKFLEDLSGISKILETDTKIIELDEADFDVSDTE